jgi:Carboxypeptidase regulatory-like domain
MSLNFNRPVRPATIFVTFVLAITFLMSSTLLLAQTTVATGSIQGTVTDSSGAVVSGAKVVITDKSRGSAINTTTNSSGSYASGALVPGDYVVRVEAPGFKSSQLPLTIQVNTTANGNLSLQVGQTTETVEVEASSVQVNTEQAEVQGVLTSQQIENLPVNGRNFLDLAQLEPGVQIQDGTNFDPTKVGYSSISFGGRFGRTARINVDGVDVSDETVGTTTEDIPASAIEEFSIAQSNLDLSNDLTSSGAVNVVTKSGTNGFHGEGFGYYRDSTVGSAALPTPPGLPVPSWQQSQVLLRRRRAYLEAPWSAGTVWRAVWCVLWFLSRSFP